MGRNKRIQDEQPTLRHMMDLEGEVEIVILIVPNVE